MELKAFLNTYYYNTVMGKPLKTSDGDVLVVTAAARLYKTTNATNIHRKFLKAPSNPTEVAYMTSILATKFNIPIVDMFTVESDEFYDDVVIISPQGCPYFKTASGNSFISVNHGPSKRPDIEKNDRVQKWRKLSKQGTLIVDAGQNVSLVTDGKAIPVDVTNISTKHDRKGFSELIHDKATYRIMKGGLLYKRTPKGKVFHEIKQTSLSFSKLHAKVLGWYFETKQQEDAEPEPEPEQEPQEPDPEEEEPEEEPEEPGTEEEPEPGTGTHPGETELSPFKNTGSTCFVDSVLYALFVTQNSVIDKYILHRDLDEPDFSHDFGCVGDTPKESREKLLDVQKVLGNLAAAIRTPRSEQAGALACDNFYNVVQKCSPLRFGQRIQKNELGDTADVLDVIFSLFQFLTLTKSTQTSFFKPITKDAPSTLDRAQKFTTVYPLLNIFGYTLNKWKHDSRIHSLEEAVRKYTTKDELEDPFRSEKDGEYRSKSITATPVVKITEPYLVISLSRRSMSEDDRIRAMNQHRKKSKKIISDIRGDTVYVKVNIPEKLQVKKQSLQCTAIVAYINEGHFGCYFKYKDLWYLFDDLPKQSSYVGTWEDMIKHSPTRYGHERTPEQMATLVFYTADSTSREEEHTGNRDSREEHTGNRDNELEDASLNALIATKGHKTYAIRKDNRFGVYDITGVASFDWRHLDKSTSLARFFRKTLCKESRKNDNSIDYKKPKKFKEWQMSLCKNVSIAMNRLESVTTKQDILKAVLDIFTRNVVRPLSTPEYMKVRLVQRNDLLIGPVLRTTLESLERRYGLEYSLSGTKESDLYIMGEQLTDTIRTLRKYPHLSDIARSKEKALREMTDKQTENYNQMLHKYKDVVFIKASFFERKMKTYTELVQARYKHMQKLFASRKEGMCAYNKRASETINKHFTEKLLNKAHLKVTSGEFQNDMVFFLAIQKMQPQQWWRYTKDFAFVPKEIATKIEKRVVRKISSDALAKSTENEVSRFDEIFGLLQFPTEHENRVIREEKQQQEEEEEQQEERPNKKQKTYIDLTL